MAAAAREGTPPPIIGKAGRYTVFITPPATPKTPSPSPRPLGLPSGLSPSPGSTPKRMEVAPTATKVPSPSPQPPLPPPVQVPPLQFDGKPSSSPSNSAFGFFWDAVAKVQDAHSRLDEYLAYWLGLNQSKYQWALNDYYEIKATDLEAGKAKDLAGKAQSM
ncbi:unnamed protein product [Spirodela intermedia]|uniref:Uncharacterized protein n=1 Tax=Spirodela intermedia TaxID=51605 RepID=A0A7I8LH46_SPIIN|nr:unnamed protein product [Spirodela intermedia]